MEIALLNGTKQAISLGTHDSTAQNPHQLSIQSGTEIALLQESKQASNKSEPT